VYLRWHSTALHAAARADLQHPQEPDKELRDGAHRPTWRSRIPPCGSACRGPTCRRRWDGPRSMATGACCTWAAAGEARAWTGGVGAARHYGEGGQGGGPFRGAGLEGIVALDGTWAQAKTMWWRNAWLLKLKRSGASPVAALAVREAAQGAAPRMPVHHRIGGRSAGGAGRGRRGVRGPARALRAVARQVPGAVKAGGKPSADGRLCASPRRRVDNPPQVDNLPHTVAAGFGLEFDWSPLMRYKLLFARWHLRCWRLRNAAGDSHLAGRRGFPPMPHRSRKWSRRTPPTSIPSPMFTIPPSRHICRPATRLPVLPS